MCNVYILSYNANVIHMGTQFRWHSNICLMKWPVPSPAVTVTTSTQDSKLWCSTHCHAHNWCTASTSSITSLKSRTSKLISELEGVASHQTRWCNEGVALADIIDLQPHPPFSLTILFFMTSCHCRHLIIMYVHVAIQKNLCHSGNVYCTTNISRPTS